MNWNISVTLGKEIKRDCYLVDAKQQKLRKNSKKVKWIKICLNKGEPSSKAKYDI